MNKPFTLKVQETEKDVVEVLNKSELPAFALKIVLQNLYNELDKLDMEEINKYNEKNSKQKEKESEK